LAEEGMRTFAIVYVLVTLTAGLLAAAAGIALGHVAWGINWWGEGLTTRAFDMKDLWDMNLNRELRMDVRFLRSGAIPHFQGCVPRV
jgi:hypothetical protein